MYVCVHVGYVHMSVNAGASRGQKRRVGSPELEFPAVVNLGCSSINLGFGFNLALLFCS